MATMKAVLQKIMDELFHDWDDRHDPECRLGVLGHPDVETCHACCNDERKVDSAR
jgi:hypothetical protein